MKDEPMFLFAVIGGVGFVLVPYACLLALAAPGSEKLPHWVLGVYGGLALTGLASSFALMLVGGFWIGLGIAIVAAVAVWVHYRRKTKVDFVVEEPLLGEATDAHARAALLEVAEEARKRQPEQGPKEGPAGPFHDQGDREPA